MDVAVPGQPGAVQPRHKHRETLMASEDLMRHRLEPKNTKDKCYHRKHSKTHLKMKNLPHVCVALGQRICATTSREYKYTDICVSMHDVCEKLPDYSYIYTSEKVRQACLHYGNDSRESSCKAV